jgi:hypothetical protein
VWKVVTNIVTNYAAALSPDGRKFDLQRGLLPQRVDLLLAPVVALRLERHVEVEEHLGQDDAHLVVCKAGYFC